MMKPEAEIRRIRRTGRRAAIALFALTVGGFTAVCSFQILTQVWSPAIVPTTQSCTEGLRGLLLSVERARVRAAGETGGEKAALSAFRQALEPEWSLRGALGEKCGAEPAGRRSLELLDWLRYGEEHAVRYEAVDLARLRRDARTLQAQLESGKI